MAGFQPLSGEAIHSPYGTIAGKHRSYEDHGATGSLRRRPQGIQDQTFTRTQRISGRKITSQSGRSPAAILA